MYGLITFQSLDWLRVCGILLWRGTNYVREQRFERPRLSYCYKMIGSYTNKVVKGKETMLSIVHLWGVVCPGHQGPTRSSLAAG